jgi:hypothetical protein
MVSFNWELIIRVVISALAAYRVARMLAAETGPFAWFSKWRGAMMVRFPKSKVVAEGVFCPLCIGFYVAAVMLGLTYIDYVVFLVIWQAVAGLQVAVQKQESFELPEIVDVRIVPEKKEQK